MSWMSWAEVCAYNDEEDIKMKKSSYDKIGEVAMLESLAEESAELAKASLKLARIKRGENPASMTEAEATTNLIEECCDVYLVMFNSLVNAPWFDMDEFFAFVSKKLARWENRTNIDLT